MPLRLVCFLLSFILTSCTGIKNDEKDVHPNIILFMVDDMGWQDTSVPFWKEETEFNRRYHTPGMERLASEGMMFTQAYASSVCSPSRVSLMSGMNAARHRVTNWTLRRNASVDASHEILAYPDWNVNGVQPVDTIERSVYATMLPQILKDQGYFTIHCGKAHFGAMNTPAARPENCGFDVNIAGHAAGGLGSYLGTENFGNRDKGSHTLPWGVPGLEKYHGDSIFLTEALTIEAKKAMDKALASNKPFYLYMAHYAVHIPLNADRRFYQKYLDMGLPEPESKYASMIEAMDKSLEDLMAYLDEKEIADNTIVMFMSDNGGLSASNRAGEPHTHNRPLNSGKGSAYEGGIREPMIVKWPGKVALATKNNTKVIIEDFFPTILEMAGIKRYKTVQTLDGKSFVPLLLNPDKETEARDLYWHYPNNWGPSGPGIGATSTIRSGDWKLIYYYRDRHFELFNIPEDIGEQNNLADKFPEKVDELAGKLGAYLRSADAQRPVIKASGQPVPWPDEILNPAEFHIHRNGIRNSLLKFQREKKGRVAFLGGSITYNGGWRDSICNYLQNRFPHTEFEFIAAGIPSMGTTPAAFRLERDVLSSGPVDLLFEEAAVNDASNGRSSQEQIRAMEGIVRHVRKENPATDIVIMHFVDPQKMDTYRSGKVPEVIQNHEKVATHYNIPTINLAKEVTERIHSGEFTWEDDFKNLHPSPFGQEVYFRSMKAFLEKAWSGTVAEGEKMEAYSLPEPIDNANYDNGKLILAEQARVINGWQFVENWKPDDGKETRQNYVNVPMLVSQEVGSSLEFQFNGNAVGITVAAGPDAGVIEFRIDERDWQKQDLFTKWSLNLHLPWYYTLAAGLAEGEHTLQVRMSGEKNPQSIGTACRIRYFYVNR